MDGNDRGHGLCVAVPLLIYDTGYDAFAIAYALTIADHDELAYPPPHRDTNINPHHHAVRDDDKHAIAPSVAFADAQGYAVTVSLDACDAQCNAKA